MRVNNMTLEVGNMGQLISIYNHPDYIPSKLTRSKKDKIMELWVSEDNINISNGVEIYDAKALEWRIRDREYGETN